MKGGKTGADQIHALQVFLGVEATGINKQVIQAKKARGRPGRRKGGSGC